MRQFEDISELESLQDIHPRDYHKTNSVTDCIARAIINSLCICWG